MSKPRRMLLQFLSKAALNSANASLTASIVVSRVAAMTRSATKVACFLSPGVWPASSSVFKSTAGQKFSHDASAM